MTASSLVLSNQLTAVMNSLEATGPSYLVRWSTPLINVLLKINNYTGYTQKNGAVSKVNKKFISHLTRAQRTPSVAATAQVSQALPAVRFSCLLRGRGASFQDGVAAGKGFPSQG